MDEARRIYDLQLERGCLRAVQAVIRREGPRGTSGEAASNVERALADVSRALAEAEAAMLDAPMRRLAMRFDLGALEQDLVWTAVVAAADPRFLIHAIALIGTEARRGLSLALYGVIADLGGADARSLTLRFGASHPLFRYQMLEASEENVTPTALAFRASNRLAAYLAGDMQLDASVLAVGGEVVVPDGLVFDDTQDVAMRQIAEALESADPPVVAIEGPVGSGRRTAAATVAGRGGRVVIALDARRLPPTAAALEHALVALRRECVLRGALPLIAEVDDLIDVDAGRARALARLLDDMPGPTIVTSSRPGLDLGLRRRLLRVDWPVAGSSRRRELWRRYLGEDGAGLDDDALAGIALRYRLGPGGIERAVGAAKLIAQARDQDGRLEAQDLIAGVRNNIAERLGSLARRVDVKQEWRDLVLSPDLVDQIQALIGRVRHAHQVYEQWGFHRKAARGLGVPALFSGPPGTGKTMVAGIMARELGLELLQVDLSQVVSKWIGETEKQLSQVFDAAEAGHALLLFDEADALFARRTEVKGATDRYANLEVNYLLQRVESFGGITILTTNLDASIDPALKRRLAAHVVFWPPDEEEREVLWRRLLDTGSAPVDRRVDLSHLARAYPDMSGANIRNAVLAAAFLAAGERTRITQEHLERAAKGEYRTMGRVLR